MARASLGRLTALLLAATSVVPIPRPVSAVMLAVEVWPSVSLLRNGARDTPFYAGRSGTAGTVGLVRDEPGRVWSGGAMAGSRDTNALQEVTRSDAVLRLPGACGARVNTPSNV
jgi:hypothetical protein